MWGRPLLIPLFSFIVGIIAADQWRVSLPTFLLPSLLALCLVSVFGARRFLFSFCLSLCFFTAGFMALSPFLLPRFSPDSIVRFVGGDPIVVEGVVDARPEWRESGGKVFLRTVRVFRGRVEEPAQGRILLFVGEGRTILCTGDLVRFISRIQRPRNFGMPGEFDYERHLAFQRVYATAFSQTADQVMPVRRGVAYPLRNRTDRIAGNMGKKIGEYLPGEEGSVLRALILGESGLVSKEIRELYARTGVSHILAISGFHVGVVAFFSFSLLFSAARRSEFLLLHGDLRRSIILLTIPLLLFYLFLSGCAPATLRSVIMISAYIIALSLCRETDSVHSLMLAAFIILLFFPPALFDISFQLSFFALWGILVLTPLLMRPFRKMRRGKAYSLLLFLMVSVAATAATMIPAAGYFHKPTIIGPLANFFIIPLMGYGVVALGFASLPFVTFLPPVAGWLLWAAGFLVNLSGRILAFLDNLPLLPVWGSKPFDLFLLFAFLASLTFLGRRVRIVGCCLTIGIFLLLRVLSWESGLGKLRLDFFSVGQGESSLITFPNGKRMLVDGGGSFRKGGFDPGERLLAPELWRRGIDRLDYMVLSHPHPDHLNGLLFLARNFSIGEFWESGIHDGNGEYLALKKILREKGVTVRRVDASTGAIAVGSAVIEPLAPLGNPELAGAEGGDNLNESSLVFRLRFHEFSILFTGDIGGDTEKWLTAEPTGLRCTILKLPHHGSRASSSEPFLAATAPKCALIGVGYNNRFHLPAADTLSRLRRRGIPVYRTDRDGTITVIFENGGWSVATFQRGRHFR